MLPTFQPAAKRRRLESAMARYSENSIAQIENIAAGTDIKAQKSGWQKRAFAIALAPARHCFQAL